MANKYLTMSFQKRIQNIVFKSYFNGKMQLLRYDDVFLNSKTLIFSVPAPLPSIRQLNRYNKEYEALQSLGIDQIYCLSSDYILIGPWAEKQSTTIRGLADTEHIFVQALAQEYQIEKPVDFLSRIWQYSILVDNGVPEQFWQNPIRVDTPWKILKHPKFRYHGCEPSKVIEYLDKNKIK